MDTADGDPCTTSTAGPADCMDNIRITTESPVPIRRIMNIFDMNDWCHSKAYEEYVQFLSEVNEKVKGVKTSGDIQMSTPIKNILEMLYVFQGWIDAYPPDDTTEQRFGNKEFRKWFERLEKDAEATVLRTLGDELKPHLPELIPYIMDSFGNKTRIDYGSGHEACFLIFLLCLKKLNYLTEDDYIALALRVFSVYLRVCRRLQMTYTLEPAGSRGSQALDDFHFIPFLWGSAQLLGQKRFVPDHYLIPEKVEIYAHTSLFLEAIKHINSVKSGPFYEHSNQLWNISAVPNWEKVNQGMLKMYQAEDPHGVQFSADVLSNIKVLKQFPVVQHFLFGKLFSYEKSANAPKEPLQRAGKEHIPLSTHPRPGVKLETFLRGEKVPTVNVSPGCSTSAEDKAVREAGSLKIQPLGGSLQAFTITRSPSAAQEKRCSSTEIHAPVLDPIVE